MASRKHSRMVADVPMVNASGDSYATPFRSSAMPFNSAIFKFKGDHSNLIDNMNRPGTRQLDGAVLCMTQTCSNAFLNSPSYMFRAIWNDLPVNIRQIQDKAEFSKTKKTL